MTWLEPKRTLLFGALVLSTVPWAWAGCAGGEKDGAASQTHDPAHEPASDGGGSGSDAVDAGGHEPPSRSDGSTPVLSDGSVEHATDAGSVRDAASTGDAASGGAADDAG